MFNNSITFYLNISSESVFYMGDNFAKGKQDSDLNRI